MLKSRIVVSLYVCDKSQNFLASFLTSDELGHVFESRKKVTWMASGINKKINSEYQILKVMADFYCLTQGVTRVDTETLLFVGTVSTGAPLTET
jgi:hypothetical protein